MSADLLAEFGPGSVAAPQSSASQRSKQPQANSLIDDFDQPSYEFSNSTPGSSHSWAQVSPAPQAPQAILPISQQPPGFEFFNLPRQGNSDVLFDAAEDQPAGDGEDEDDWGDFEGPQATQSAKPASATAFPKPQTSSTQRANTQIPATVDLLDSLSINDHKPNPITKSTSKATTQKSFAGAASKAQAAPAWDDDQDDWGDFTDGPSTKPPPQKAIKKPSKPPINIAPQEPVWDDKGFDDWGDFDDGPSTTAAPKPKIPLKAKPVKAKTKSISEPKPTQNQNYFTASTTSQSPENVRPTNIPPPSVLLDLLVTSLTNLQKEATAAKQSHVAESIKTTTANTINTTLSTTAHIIAGRQLRWKRDNILSQSMRIGPAQGRGMKLNTVNKHEDVKEAQDAVVVLDLWRERALLFSTVVQGAGLRPVPTVADPAALKVITARAEQGAIKASHACALCALRRDERVLKIDEGDVNDSFGEWWTEHWGHTACRAFWESNKQLLGQR